MDCSLPCSSDYGIIQAKILEWVAIPFSNATFQPRDQTRVSCIAGRFFTIWATRKAPKTDGSWESLDRMWSTGEGNGKRLQYSCLKNPMNSMKRQNDRILKEELPRSVGAQYATGDQCRNNSKKKEETERKQKQHPVVDVTGDWGKIWCCKEQYCIGNWNVRSMNQANWKSRKEKAWVNIDILGISKLKWSGMGKFNSDEHYIYYCGQESLRRNGVAI